jgi:glycerol transport system substrate-binding protein
MKMRLKALSVAIAMATGGHAAFADEAAAARWINNEFQPSTLSKAMVHSSCGQAQGCRCK